MAKLTSRAELKDYCLRKLGFPVIEINVDDDQVEDRIDDAFQIFFDYHYDGVERKYYSAKITQQNIDDGFITLPDSMIHVTRVLPFTGGGGAATSLYPMGDPSLAWDFTVNNPFAGGIIGSAGTSTSSDQAGGATSFDRVGYVLSMEMYESIQIMFGGEVPISFSRHTNKLHLNINWSEKLSVDDYIIVEGWATLDPDIYTDVYDDRWIKRYATAAIKMQWGANLIKYSGIQLPGGVTLDGDKMFESATAEMDKLEEEIQTKYEEPPSFFMG